jgi:hypothetical protein
VVELTGMGRIRMAEQQREQAKGMAQPRAIAA